MIMMPYAWILDIATAHRSGRLLAPHRATWRRRTATSCRRTRISTSLEVPLRASSTSQPNTRTMSR